MLAVGRPLNRYPTRVFSHPERYGPLLFAHRGYHLESPENSIEAFQEAIALGADVLEMDVRMTADGQIVVAHDPDGVRVARRDAQIAQIEYSELVRWNLRDGLVSTVAQAPPVRMPRFVDVLNAFPEASLNVDVKQLGPRMVRTLLTLIGEQGASHRVLLTSFSETNLRSIRRAGYRGPVGVSRWGVARAVLLPEPLVFGGTFPRLRFLRRSQRMPERPSGRDGRRRMQIPLHAGALRLDTRSVLERAHRLGYQVDYWVVDDAAEAERLLDLGADGIVTDNVPAIAEVYRYHVRTAAYRERWAASLLAADSSDRNVGSFK